MGKGLAAVRQVLEISKLLNSAIRLMTGRWRQL